MTSDRVRAILPALNAVAFLLIASPAIDLIGAVVPARPAEVSWRFGVFGLLTNSLVTPMLGLAIMQVVATLLEQRRTVRRIALFVLVLDIVMVLGLGLFVLDYIQLRQAVTGSSRGAYDAAAIKALLVGVLEISVLASLVVTGFQSTGGAAGGNKKRRRRERVGLVVQAPDEERPLETGH
jgi:hypothetical protein